MAGLVGFLTGDVQHAAVVAGEDDEGLVSDVELVEGVEDFADHPIELVNEVAVESAVAGADELFGWSEWVMDVGGGEVEEEGLVAVLLLDPLDGLVLEGRADEVVDVKFVSFFCAADAAVATFLGVDFCDGLFAGFEGVLGVVSDDVVVFHINEGRTAVHGGDAEVVIEADFEWTGFEGLVPIGFLFAEAEVPFADAGGGVALAFEDGGEGVLFWVDGQGLSMRYGAP